MVLSGSFTIQKHLFKVFISFLFPLYSYSILFLFLFYIYYLPNLLLVNSILLLFLFCSISTSILLLFCFYLYSISILFLSYFYPISILHLVYFISNAVKKRLVSNFPSFHSRCLFLLLKFPKNLDSRCLFFDTFIMFSKSCTSHEFL